MVANNQGGEHQGRVIRRLRPSARFQRLKRRATATDYTAKILAAFFCPDPDRLHTRMADAGVLQNR